MKANILILFLLLFPTLLFSQNSSTRMFRVSALSVWEADVQRWRGWEDATGVITMDFRSGNPTIGLHFQNKSYTFAILDSEEEQGQTNNGELFNAITYTVISASFPQRHEITLRRFTNSGNIEVFFFFPDNTAIVFAVTRMN